MLARIFVKDNRLRPSFRVLVYILAALAAQLILAIIVGAAYALVRGPGALLTRTPVWLDELIGTIAVVGAAVLLRAFLDRRSVASLGISFTPRSALPECGKLFALGMALGGGMQVLFLLIELALGHSHVLSVQFTRPVVLNVAFWTVFFLYAALAEEYPLRGYILQNLWEDWGYWPAAIITALGFAALHVGNPNFGEMPWLTVFNIAVDGIWAALAVLWTRSLWLAWGQHFAWNVFEGPLLGTPVSGIYTGPSAVTQTITGNTLVTGGKFGPEASILLPLVELATLAVLYALYKRGAFAHAPDNREAYARADEIEE
ncbi:MAG: CPBP family intramembrane metalloprotease, partial [Candidatus Eremiobacteraeota bacterium]|nr:CPBP family intramembrane metalloprotease [Candidatus Eremiobacteraeota bacterium]